MYMSGGGGGGTGNAGAIQNLSQELQFNIDIKSFEESQASPLEKLQVVIDQLASHSAISHALQVVKSSILVDHQLASDQNPLGESMAKPLQDKKASGNHFSSTHNNKIFVTNKIVL
mmetsp:Transcript_41786/g.40136  ORF Transcript_41786/g.40136 Transcript_41786/m.40136 type:complete len:116 (+) Transcript_41786:70-417(+)